LQITPHDVATNLAVVFPPDGYGTGRQFRFINIRYKHKNTKINKETKTKKKTKKNQ
jgi:hypothetical protein